jgi:hypothetical protein
VPLSRAGTAAAAVSLAALVACAAPAGQGGPRPTRSDGFVRVVSPFPVTDSAGRALSLAFLGGLTAPRPQLLDADGDGDLDLFLQDMTGAVALFEREGDADGLPRFMLADATFAGLDVGEWYRFADVDLDGDVDLLAESPFSYIRYYRNEGQRGAPRFTLAADTLRDVDGQPLFADRQNIAQLGDLDCNQRADLLIGRLDGTVTRYEAAEQVSASGVPRFRLVAQEFEGIRIIGQTMGIGGPGSMHGANTMALADHDEDGDLDLFWGDYFEQGLLLIENTGTCAAPNLRNTPVQFPPSAPVLTSGYNAPAFGDVLAAGQGTLELVIGVLGGAYNPNRTASENLYLLGRTASGGWEVRTRQLLPMIDVGMESIPALGDLDGDGDLDLLLANKLDPVELTTSRIYRFENVGTRLSPSFRMAGKLPFSGRYHYAPAFGDLTGDGRADLVLGQWGASLAWYHNAGGELVLADSALLTITRGSNTVPALGDLDGDGDLDLLVGEASGWVNYYRNEGGRDAPKFVLVTDELDGTRVGRRSAPALADIDRDGDLDLIIGSDRAELVLLRNLGDASTPRFVRDSSFAVAAHPLAAPAAGDLDGDGDVDLVVGGAAGGALYLDRRR